MLKSKQRLELLGIALLAISVFLALSLIPPSLFGGAGIRAFPEGNLMGVLGRIIADAGVSAFGAGFPLLIVLAALAGCASFGWMQSDNAFRWAALATGIALLLPTGAALLTSDTGVPGRAVLPSAAAGWLGHTLAVPLVALLGWFGAWLVVALLLVVVCVATIGWN